jgi:23S rRNA (uracil1939-C5)-methyltransferase
MVAEDSGGQEVIVSGSLPGELVTAEVYRERNGRKRARRVEIEEPSPYRTAPSCPEVIKGCGGCQWQHIDLTFQRDLKQNLVREAVAKIPSIQPSVVAPLVALPANAFRTSLRAAVTDGRAGLRKASAVSRH